MFAKQIGNSMKVYVNDMLDTDQCLLFFKTLKGNKKVVECALAFKNLKAHMGQAPILSKPKVMDILSLYLSVSPR